MTRRGDPERTYRAQRAGKFRRNERRARAPLSCGAGASGACGRLSGDAGLPGVGAVNLASEDRVRLYLFDAPEGMSMRVLAIVIGVPESSFERAVTAAIAVEFHVP